MWKYTCAALLALTLAAPGLAAVTVFGSADAVSCYQAADGRSSKRTGLENCDRALSANVLSRQHRAATHVNRGIILMHLGEADRAIADYERALEIDDGLGAAWVNRGIARLYRDRDNRLVLADLDRGIALGTPDPEVAYYMRAVAHENLGNLRAAYEDYRTASRLQPEVG